MDSFGLDRRASPPRGWKLLRAVTSICADEMCAYCNGVKRARLGEARVKLGADSSALWLLRASHSLRGLLSASNAIC
jgi:hypothetical protein